MDRPLHLLGIIAALFVLGTLPFLQGNPVLPWFKALPALLWALSCLVHSGPGRLWGAIALGFSAMADHLLARSDAFLPGVVAFCLVQLVLSYRFWSLALVRPRPRRGFFTIPLVLAGVYSAVILFTWQGLGTLAVPYALYGILLTATVSGAWICGGGWVLAWGAGIFFLSDTLILVRELAHWDLVIGEWVVLVPYYLAQGLLAKAVPTTSNAPTTMTAGLTGKSRAKASANPLQFISKP